MNGASPRYHVLLVGIDAYQKGDPLFGSVNDVDALESVCLDRLSVPSDAITKLVAPHAGMTRRSRVPEDKPTTAHLRRALEKLATDAVRPDDRILIHYSGHGTQVMSRFSRTVREALVPVDALAGGELLFDDEINDILRRIAARTQDLTVILDCCCSAGATRSGIAASGAVRFCHIADDVAKAPTFRSSRSNESSGLLASFDPSDPGFLVAASAQSGEAAHEVRDARGVRHGAFTAALLDLLEMTSADKLAALRWADIWQTLRARIESTAPGQHPCLIGRSERRLFGGPFRRQDPGFPMTEVDGKVFIHAGSLVGLGVGATVGVYGSEPSFFPTLHSIEDQKARRGLLRIESVTFDSAIAMPIGNPVVVDDAMRGRLVRPGPADKLVVGLDRFDASLAKYLESEVFAHVVPRDEPNEREVEVVVGESRGCWWIGDDIFGEEAPLARIEKPAKDKLALGLWHYVRYRLPLRLVRHVREGIGVLRLRVLDASTANRLNKEELHDPPLPEVDPDPGRHYRHQIVNGQPVCFSVENRSAQPLYVNVINCSSSGVVEILGPKQLEIAPKRRQTFWMRGILGLPFPCRVSAGRVFSVERLVALGTSSPNVDCSYLEVKESFAAAIAAASRATTAEKEEPSDFWTATSATVKIVSAW